MKQSEKTKKSGDREKEYSGSANLYFQAKVEDRVRPKCKASHVTSFLN